MPTSLTNKAELSGFATGTVYHPIWISSKKKKKSQKEKGMIL